MSILIAVLFVLNFLILNINLLYKYQLSGYNIKELAKFEDCSKYSKLLLWLFSIIISFVAFVYFKNFYLFLIVCFCLFFIVYFSDFCFLKILKIKYTKRMIRLILLIFLLNGLLFFGVCFLSPRLIIFLILLFVFFDRVFICIATFILSPIEFVVGKYYLSIARQKLQNLNLDYRIGITGSFGKTSTKEILNTLLSESYSVISTPKSFNTPFGVSKTILHSLSHKHKIFICEMGAKKKGEIDFLAKYINVNCGIVTSVGRQHTKTFGDINGVYETKKELPNNLNDGFCVFNLQNLYVRKMYDDFLGQKIGVFIINKRLKKNGVFCCKKLLHYNKVKVWCGKYFEYLKYNNVYAKNIECFQDGILFDIWYGNEFICRANVCLLGEHNVINVLLSVAMCVYLGVSFDCIKLGMNKLKPIKARFEKIVMDNGAIVINNGYNSNIDTVKNSFKTIEIFSNKTKIIITPGLIETSDDYQYNFLMGEYIAGCFNKVIIVKQKNKKALLDGLFSRGFKRDNVCCVNSFVEAKEYISNGGCDDVFLIENDLPDNFK